MRRFALGLAFALALSLGASAQQSGGGGGGGGGGAPSGPAGGSLSGTYPNPLIAGGAVSNAMLAGSIAASKLVGTDIATVGTIGAGTWQGATIAIGFGGTGAASLAGHGAVTMNAAGTAQTVVAPGASSNVMQSNGTDWVAQIPAGVTSLDTAPLLENVANDTSTGTAAGKLVVLTTAAKVKTAAVTDTTNITGVCVAAGAAGTACGTSGNASIAIGGQVPCVFDGATTSADFVVASTTVAGDCHDGGATPPTSVAVLGQVLSTNGGAGTYTIDMNPVGISSALTAKAAPGGVNGNPQCKGGSGFVACVAANFPATTLATGTSVSLTAPREYYVCTSTCTVTPPVPAAGYEFCVLNDDNVATVITLAALGSSARYEATARTSYGTAGTGTMVSGGAVGDKICIIGRDATHYLVGSYVGTWTAS